MKLLSRLAASLVPAQTMNELSVTLASAMPGSTIPAMGAIIFRDDTIVSSAVTGNSTLPSHLVIAKTDQRDWASAASLSRAAMLMAPIQARYPV